ncbi:hypothetical protein FOTG_11572 [Fusarium oxysporum f. sp. vasinfectum 25433]|uniref:Uncharacterized protein n=1 Tax=Fusarium oxysporum f. sp. vasinfectum 25433 TaxID=1089449 RepID=X0L3D8_FUSOX|nr:hypothetical protein FOTG_11572 [Fusarium oxysporum f. sp. vasinfectum 25433]
MQRIQFIINQSSAPMLSTMSDQTFLDSIPRTFDQTSYQPTPLAMDAAINGAFDAFDGIHFDLQPFTVQETLREDSATLERRKFSWETPSTSSYHAISEDTFASDEKSPLYICSPSSVVSRAHEQLRSILPDDITGTFVNSCESNNQRVHRWLSELPDIPWLDVSYVDALQESTENEPSWAIDIGQSREPLPETEGLLNYLDFLNTCYDSIQPTSPTGEYVDYGKLELHAATDPTTTLDAYHLTLLQIDSSSAFTTTIRRKFRPSMRRRYPRGLEKEARRSISLVASSRSHE